MAIKIKEVQVEYYSDRTKDTDRPVLITFTEFGKGRIQDVKWLTITQATEIRDKLNEALKKAEKIK